MEWRAERDQRVCANRSVNVRSINKVLSIATAATAQCHLISDQYSTAVTVAQCGDVGVAHYSITEPANSPSLTCWSFCPCHMCGQAPLSRPSSQYTVRTLFPTISTYAAELENPDYVCICPLQSPLH